MIHLEVDVLNAAELLDTSAYGAGAKLRWESSATVAGTYVEGGTVNLVASQVTYDIWDTAGTVGKWYRTRISNSAGTSFSAYSEPIQGGLHPRPTMATLIARLRLMVGDPIVAGTPPTSQFTDTELQDALDHHRTDVIQDRLIARPILTQTGPQWLDYQARWGFWESDEIIVDPTFATVSPATADRLTGHWTFTATTYPNLYITGKAYDLYGAAVEILEAWLGKVRAEGDFDFSEDGQSFSRSQKGRGLESQAAEYRRKALPAGPRFAGIGIDRVGGVGP